MNRPLVLSLLVVLSLVAAPFALPVAAQSAAAITGVTTTPAQPNPGETFLVKTTVANGPSASAPFEITDVYVRAAGSSREYARVEDVGSVQPGNSITVPLPMSIKSAGSYDLRVHVVGRVDGNYTRLTFPLLVTVRESGPQVNVETDTAVVGAETTANVTVVNGGDSPISSLRVTVDGDQLDVPTDTQIAATLAAGASRTFGFTVTPTARTATLRAELSYTTAEGVTRVVRSTKPLAADPLVRDVSLDARVASQGADPPIAVSIANFGNTALEDVTVAALVDGQVVARRPAPDVPAEGERTVQVNVSDVPNGPVELRVSYDAAGEPDTASTTIDYRSNPGQVELTGVDYTLEDGAVHVSGSVSNVGLSEVNSVVVRVVPSDGVTPARPYPDYFVGTVPASDFASFDLYADVDQGVDAIPVEVTYLVDGKQRVATSDIAVTDLPPPQPPASSGPSLLTMVGGAVAVIVVVAIGVFLYRRR